MGRDGESAGRPERLDSTASGPVRQRKMIGLGWVEKREKDVKAGNDQEKKRISQTPSQWMDLKQTSKHRVKLIWSGLNGMVELH